MIITWFDKKSGVTSTLACSVAQYHPGSFWLFCSAILWSLVLSLWLHSRLQQLLMKRKEVNIQSASPRTCMWFCFIMARQYSLTLIFLLPLLFPKGTFGLGGDSIWMVP